MADDAQRPPDVALANDETHGWWLAVLEGKDESGHPIFGKAIETRVDGGTLFVTGTVPTEEARRQVEAEIGRLRSQGISDVDTNLEVGTESDEELGVLLQTLVAIFQNTDQANLAASRLREGAVFHSPTVQVLNTPDAAVPSGVATTMPAAVADEVREQLDEGHAVLVATVDETEAFKARQLLDEDTRSLKTLVLPPRATPGAERREGGAP